MPCMNLSDDRDSAVTTESRFVTESDPPRAPGHRNAPRFDCQQRFALESRVNVMRPPDERSRGPGVPYSGRPTLASRPAPPQSTSADDMGADASARGALAPADSHSHPWPEQRFDARTRGKSPAR